MDAKAGKADVLAGRFHLVEREQVGAVADRHGAAVRDFEDVDTLFVQEAAMEELGGEPESLSAPQRMPRVETDGAIVLVVEFVKFVR